MRTWTIFAPGEPFPIGVLQAPPEIEGFAPEDTAERIHVEGFWPRHTHYRDVETGEVHARIAVTCEIPAAHPADGATPLLLAPLPPNCGLSITLPSGQIIEAITREGEVTLTFSERGPHRIQILPPHEWLPLEGTVHAD